MERLVESVQRYARETLGIDFRLADFDAARLPFFLRDRYRFREARLESQTFVLFFSRDNQELPPSTIRKDSATLHERSGVVPIWATPHITAYDRRRLIENRVAFIVPQVQAYLPPLLIDLREQFRVPRPRNDARVSPATQAILLDLIYHRVPDIEAITAGRVFTRYSRMTLSRAMGELENHALVTIEQRGRNKLGHFPLTGRMLWERALPLLRNPVRAKLFLSQEELDRLSPHLMAGLSALARHSDLSPPRRMTFAISPRFSVAGNRGQKIRGTPHIDEAVAELELWSYAPLLEAAPHPTVDRLSLYLSLRDDPDERVQTALRQLLESVF